ncbi:MAG: transcriptional repressor [Firmicutes bacterium]|nr:transcriptional repressor [Bacillota bacterium]
MDILIECLKKKELKITDQRKVILRVFLKSAHHVSAEELHDQLKHENQTIGLATVYRTLKLLCDCGLASELRLSDGIVRYEHLFGHEHHDHLCCLQCDKIIEVIDPEIEELQQRLAEKNDFKVLSHRMELYGICKECGRE